MILPRAKIQRFKSAVETRKVLFPGNNAYYIDTATTVGAYALCQYDAIAFLQIYAFQLSYEWTGLYKQCKMKQTPVDPNIQTSVHTLALVTNYFFEDLFDAEQKKHPWIVGILTIFKQMKSRGIRQLSLGEMARAFAAEKLTSPDFVNQTPNHIRRGLLWLPVEYG